MDSPKNPPKAQKNTQESLNNLIGQGGNNEKEDFEDDENQNIVNDDQESSIEYQKYLMRLQEEEDVVEKGTVYIDQNRYITLEICEASKPFERPFIEMALTKQKRSDIVSVENPEEEDNDDIILLQVTKPKPPRQKKQTTPKKTAVHLKPKLSLVRVKDDKNIQIPSSSRKKIAQGAVNELFRDSQHANTVKPHCNVQPPPGKSVRKLVRLEDEIRVKPPEIETSDIEDPLPQSRKRICTISLQKNQEYVNSEKRTIVYAIKSGQCAFDFKGLQENEYKRFSFSDKSEATKLTNQEVRIIGLSDDPSVIDIIY